MCNWVKDETLQILLQILENERGKIVLVNSKFSESCSSWKKQCANLGLFGREKVIIIKS